MVFEYTTAKRRMIFSMDVSSAFIQNSIDECEQQKKLLKRLESKLTNTFFFWRTFCSCSSVNDRKKATTTTTTFLYVHCALAACVVFVPSWCIVLLSFLCPKLHNLFIECIHFSCNFTKRKTEKMANSQQVCLLNGNYIQTLHILKQTNK